MQWLKHVIRKITLAFSTTDLSMKQLTGGLKVQAYILMAFYCQQSFLLMCLTLSCSKGLGCGEFTADWVIFRDPPCRTRSSRFWIANVPAITKNPVKILSVTCKPRGYFSIKWCLELASPLTPQVYSMLPSIRTLQFKIAITFLC